MEYVIYFVCYIAFIVVVFFMWARGIEQSIEKFPEPDDAQPSGFDSNLPR